MAENILGFSLQFLFFGMKEEDNRFNNLQLFDSYDNIDVRHKEERKVVGGKLYSIRIFSDLINYSEILDLVFDEISLQLVYLEELGLKEGINFEFFLEYDEEIQWSLKNYQLKKLDVLTKGIPSISLNSINTSWSDARHTYEQIIFHELFFSLKSPYSDEVFIEKKLKEEFFDKYQNHINWNIQINEKEDTKELQLSLKEGTEKFDWDEQYKDLLNFISKYSRTLHEENIVITYGYFQQNRSDMSGGEIGFELMKEITQLGIDLKFSLNSEAPKILKKY